MNYIQGDGGGQDLPVSEGLKIGSLSNCIRALTLFGSRKARLGLAYGFSIHWSRSASSNR